MARILFCPSNCFVLENGSYHIGSFHEQIVDEFVKYGNDVLVYNPLELNRAIFASDNKVKKNIDNNLIKKQIRNFNPDFVLTLNNACHEDILSLVDCKIAVWDADFVTYWNCIDDIKKNPERYLIFSFSSHMVDKYKQYFSFNDNNIHVVKSATSVHNTNSDKIKNISFIGTKFIGDVRLTDAIKSISNSGDRAVLFNMLQIIKSNPYISKDELISNEDFRLFSDFLSQFNDFTGFFAAENRIATLLSIYDLGLHLYGTKTWRSKRFVNDFPGLAACYDSSFVYSKQHNEDIYNSSKICFNVMHPQSVQSMPYRITDILASGGCLVSEYSSAIVDNFDRYVKLPIFQNQYEARELCKKILKDDDYRSDIVLASNDIIDKQWRWVYRFKQMEDILGLNLVSENKVGSLDFIKPKYLYKLSSSKFQDLKNKWRIKKYKRLQKRLKDKGLLEAIEDEI